MRRTRLVILPIKCLHQMGFLLLFLSCPVIGDWGRIRPESENSHKAIRIDREGTCALRRDPSGKLLNFLYEDGSDQCQLSEEFDTDGITRKPVFREIRKYEERQTDSQRVTRERNVRESERREANDERKDVRKEMQRVADERRNVRKELRKDIRRDMREISQIRIRSTELRQTSRGGRQENKRATTRQVLDSARRISTSNGMKSRNFRERLHQVRRNIERQNERRTEQHRRSVMEVTVERRENERTTRTKEEMRERETQRLVRSAERENQGIRLGDNRRSLRERSLKNRESDVRMRKFREQDQGNQNERLSLARKEQNNIRRSEKGRNYDNPERRLSQIRKTRIMEIDGEVTQRLTRIIENRRDAGKRKSSRGDIRERRVAPLNTRLEFTSTRVSDVTKQQSLPHGIGLENKNPNEKVPGGIMKWMDFKGYEGFKAKMPPPGENFNKFHESLTECPLQEFDSFGGGLDCELCHWGRRLFLLDETNKSRLSAFSPGFLPFLFR